MSRKTKITVAVIAAAIAVTGGIIYTKAIKSKPPDDASVKLTRHAIDSLAVLSAVAGGAP